MNGERAPVPRTIAQIVDSVEQQFARGQLVTMLPTDLRRLIGAARDGDPDALRLAAIVVQASAQVGA